MLDGIPLIDVHLHAATLPSFKPDPVAYASGFGNDRLSELYGDDGAILPQRFDAYLHEEGVDRAYLLAEYSPKVVGVQPLEDLLPVARYNPARFRLVANLNPHYHHPIASELERQLGLGAVALKVHPVHGGFTPATAELYPAYQLCEQRGLPVIFHCGTSSFPGATNRYADPALMDEVARDFPRLRIVLAHGGRGWWYDAAAFLALSRPNVWLEISGLPPRKLPEYYNRWDLPRLARKMIFGSDWPGVPGIRANAVAVAALGFERAELEAVLWRNAEQVYG